MFAQQNKLKELFDEYGWELIETYNPKEWWITDFWVIKSLWTPKGCKVYLSFLVDEQLEDKTKAKFNVWAIRLSLNEIPNFNAEEHFEVSIKTKWEKRIPEIFGGLENLRAKFDKTFREIRQNS